MARVRGAAASTSGQQDQVSLDEAALDQVITHVAASAQKWAATSPGDRARLLERVVKDTFEVSRAWNAAGCAAKGYDPESSEGGEELFSGIGTFVRMAQCFRASMLDIAAKGRPQFPGPVRHKPDRRIAVQVIPANLFDKLLYAGITGEVWMEPGVDEAEVRSSQAAAYRSPQSHAGVSLVLGAGNVASLGPRDVLTKMFAEGKVVILKANPVNDYLVPYWSQAMKSLIEPGFLRIVSGGAKVGEYLTHHPAIEDIHVTGSDKTHDAIVFGPGPEGARRKANNEPVVTKPVTCELGNVSPVVIVPGEWSSKEIEFQAKHVATMITNNAGFNCLTPRVIITHEGWAQRGEFFTALEKVFSTLPTRLAYYPGAQERRSAFLAAHPDAHEIGSSNEGRQPWTIVRDVDATNHEDVCLNVEAFCALTSETALAGETPADFVRKATDFCNDVVWGTLSMTLIADPRTMRDPVTGPAIEQAIADLRYGSIGVNLWHAMSFALATTVWGAYPGHLATDIQSGNGFVGNSFLFAHPQKSVVRGPFVARPEPAWFATNTNGAVVMGKLLDFEVRPSWTKIPGLMLAALKS
ncbi:MAG: aldehyde dehydrogenase family protein [Acidimicrobiaceae bacterium]|nr:aldehyde dehydrogenase family protein [Acidimicrobiaceae bacterium]